MTKTNATVPLRKRPRPSRESRHGESSDSSFCLEDAHLAPPATKRRIVDMPSDNALKPDNSKTTLTTTCLADKRN